MKSPLDRHKKPTVSGFDADTVAQLKNRLACKTRLLDYYEIGEQLKNIECTESGQRGTNWRKKLAKKLGVSDSTLGKCLQFRRRYERNDLPELESLRIPWAHLSIAFSIEDKRTRFRVLKQAKKNRWGERGLQREIQRIKGSCRGGGRKRKKPRSRGLLADTLELASLSEIWNRFYELAFTNSMNGAAGGDQRVGVELRNHLNHCLKALRALSKNVNSAKRSIKELLANLQKESSADSQ